MLQNTGAVISIAFVLASSPPRSPSRRAVRDLLRRDARACPTRSSSRSSTTCTPRCGCSRRRRRSAPSCRLMRPPHERRRTHERRRRHASRGPLRIGEVAERVGTTARTIRYYEEIGLLGGARPSASRPPPPLHRGRRRAAARDPAAQATCSASRSTSSRLVEAEDARDALRAEWRQPRTPGGSGASCARRSATSTASSRSSTPPAELEELERRARSAGAVARA